MMLVGVLPITGLDKSDRLERVNASITRSIGYLMSSGVVLVAAN